MRRRRRLHPPPPLPLSLWKLKVVEEFEREGMVTRVDGNQDIESVFRDVILGLKSVHEKEVVDANRLAVEAVCTGDWAAYAQVGGVCYRSCEHPLHPRLHHFTSLLLVRLLGSNC